MDIDTRFQTARNNGNLNEVVECLKQGVNENRSDIVKAAVRILQANLNLENQSRIKQELLNANSMNRAQKEEKEEIQRLAIRNFYQAKAGFEAAQENLNQARNNLAQTDRQLQQIGSISNSLSSLSQRSVRQSNQSRGRNPQPLYSGLSSKNRFEESVAINSMYHDIPSNFQNPRNTRY